VYTHSFFEGRASALDADGVAALPQPAAASSTQAHMLARPGLALVLAACWRRRLPALPLPLPCPLPPAAALAPPAPARGRHDRNIKFAKPGGRPLLFREEDVQESFMRGSGRGGQSVARTANKVVLVHVPSGETVRCHGTRSRDLNRQLARRELALRLDAAAHGPRSLRALAAAKRQKAKAKARSRALAKHGGVAERRAAAGLPPVPSKRQAAAAEAAAAAAAAAAAEAAALVARARAAAAASAASATALPLPPRGRGAGGRGGPAWAMPRLTGLWRSGRKVGAEGGAEGAGGGGRARRG
jgi:hypothetical protein